MDVHVQNWYQRVGSDSICRALEKRPITSNKEQPSYSYNFALYCIKYFFTHIWGNLMAFYGFQIEQFHHVALKSPSAFSAIMLYLQLIFLSMESTCIIF